MFVDCFNVGLDLPTRARGLVCVGDGLNFRNVVAGDDGREPKFGGDSVGLMLTETGFDNGSCLDGILSGGGPIGLSSLLRLRLFSNFPLSSVDFPFELFRSLRSSVRFFDCVGPAIGVIVIELGKVVCGDDAIGIISMPGLLSKPIPVSTEL